MQRVNANIIDLREDWRIEKAPRLIAVVFEPGDDPRAILPGLGIPAKYLSEGKDAKGNTIEAGKVLHFHAWLSRDWIWHVFRKVDDVWSFVQPLDLPRDQAIRHVENLMEKPDGLCA